MYYLRGDFREDYYLEDVGEDFYYFSMFFGLCGR